ncbi:sulfate adenylyltransferase subunit CysN [Sulfidibacter corallicola]|uniref:Sulfate adenylyltransferase subunit 1 n=1 Tax=Sulfidibacter corallicola TaxID=2818388 RepID=A0A8A4TLV7_SULCO|nr:sulfate adenylyltransferase subunit CysN [Sulfidibacter corallicola]QTD50092.1 sulfate adenylyltransferase subunit CysN [Sulfidibacter corallicola]
MSEPKTHSDELTRFLAEEGEKELVRISTAGSVDDGKSTLIGRLLHDTQNIYEDQLHALADESARGSASRQVDWALLTDGLKAEREQGITIDVAYRYFSSHRRKFILADTPGHEQYTRNMATGASTADLAIVLVDARKGLRRQSKRHAFIAALLGIPHMVVAVNKMDLVGYDEAVFERIRDEFSTFATRLGIPDLRFLPISALVGDNVVATSDRMPWYRGEPLLQIMESVFVAGDRNLVDLRLPVQYVNRPHQDFRGYCGQMVSGILRKGSKIEVLPSGKQAHVASITTYDGELDEAAPPMSITVTLDRELDIGRGDMLIHPHNRPTVNRHLEAMMVWMDEMPLDPETRYLVKQTTRTTTALISEVRYRVDVDNLTRQEAAPLQVNEIGRVVLLAQEDLYFDAYHKNRGTGSLILIHPLTHRTVAAGMIIDRQPSDQLPASMDVTRAPISRRPMRQGRVTRDEVARRLDQRPRTLWLTGLVSSGKSEIAYALERKLFERGKLATVLDGGKMRRGLSRELGFGSAGVAENLRRAAETARLFNEAGLIAICSFVSPVAKLREQVSEIVGPDQFSVVHVDATPAHCEARDETGLYRQAREGLVQNLAGWNSPYEAPDEPDVYLDMTQLSIDACVEKILEFLERTQAD